MDYKKMESCKGQWIFYNDHMKRYECWEDGVRLAAVRTVMMLYNEFPEALIDDTVREHVKELEKLKKV